MKIHYLNCGTMYPRGAPLFVPYAERSCCICMLLESGEGLVLVDTGFGTRDMADPNRLGHLYNFVMNIQTDPEEPAVRQVEKMGFDPGDVRDIICTHVDPDHAGGLSDFPQANIHVSRTELDMLTNPLNHLERTRVCRAHFSHEPKWVAHDVISEEKWFGMDCMRDIPGLPSEAVLVPLPGHTRGQVGVAVCDEAAGGWVAAADNEDVLGELHALAGVRLSEWHRLWRIPPGAWAEDGVADLTHAGDVCPGPGQPRAGQPLEETQQATFAGGRLRKGREHRMRRSKTNHNYAYD